MKQVSLLIKPASASCNIHCEYCFYRKESEQREIRDYGIMTSEVMEKLIDFSFLELDQDGDVSYAFQGGEPTLATLSFFDAFIANVEKKRRNQRVHYALQSNGLLLDDKWIAFLKKHHFLVGISLDGFQSNHDYYRKDKQGVGTFKKVMETIDRLKQAQMDYNIVCVLSNRLADHPQRLYEFFKEQKFPYIQLISCMDDLKEHYQGSLTPEKFYAFYHTYFSLWWKDYQEGKAQHINLFDNILLMIQDQRPYQCGMLGFCVPQLVVEGDGSLYPCDFYVNETTMCGTVQTHTPSQVVQEVTLQNFLRVGPKKRTPCLRCPYDNLCHGGCKRMNSTFLSSTYCGYQELLKEIVPKLLSIL